MCSRWANANIGNLIGVVVRDSYSASSAEAMLVASDTAVCVVSGDDFVSFLAAHGDASFVTDDCVALLAMARCCGQLAYEALLELVYANRLHDVTISDGLLRLALRDELPTRRSLVELFLQFAKVDDHGRLLNDDVALLDEPIVTIEQQLQQQDGVLNSTNVADADNDDNDSDDDRARDIEDDAEDTVAAATAAMAMSSSDAAVAAADDEPDDDGYLREFAAVYGDQRAPSRANRAGGIGGTSSNDSSTAGGGAQMRSKSNAAVALASEQVRAARSGDLARFEEFALARDAVRRLVCTYRAIVRETLRLIESRAPLVAEMLPDAQTQFGLLTESIQLKATLALDEMHRRGVCIDLARLRELQRRCVSTHAATLGALAATERYARIFSANSLAECLASVRDDTSSSDVNRVKRPLIDTIALRALLSVVVDEVCVLITLLLFLTFRTLCLDRRPVRRHCSIRVQFKFVSHQDCVLFNLLQMTSTIPLFRARRER